MEWFKKSQVLEETEIARKFVDDFTDFLREAESKVEEIADDIDKKGLWPIFASKILTDGEYRTLNTKIMEPLRILSSAISDLFKVEELIVGIASLKHKKKSQKEKIEGYTKEQITDMFDRLSEITTDFIELAKEIIEEIRRFIDMIPPGPFTLRTIEYMWKIVKEKGEEILRIEPLLDEIPRAIEDAKEIALERAVEAPPEIPPVTIEEVWEKVPFPYVEEPGLAPIRSPQGIKGKWFIKQKTSQ